MKWIPINCDDIWEFQMHVNAPLTDLSMTPAAAPCLINKLEHHLHWNITIKALKKVQDATAFVWFLKVKIAWSQQVEQAFSIPKSNHSPFHSEEPQGRRKLPKVYCWLTSSAERESQGHKCISWQQFLLFIVQTPGLILTSKPAAAHVLMSSAGSGNICLFSYSWYAATLPV